MLNIGDINSQIIYFGNQLEPMRRKIFFKKSSHEVVVIEQTQRKSQIKSGLNYHLQVRLQRFLPNDDWEKSPEIPNSNVETGKRRYLNYDCKKCGNALYLSHANMVCGACSLVCRGDSTNQL